MGSIRTLAALAALFSLVGCMGDIASMAPHVDHYDVHEPPAVHRTVPPQHDVPPLPPPPPESAFPRPDDHHAALMHELESALAEANASGQEPRTPPVAAVAPPPRAPFQDDSIPTPIEAQDQETADLMKKLIRDMAVGNQEAQVVAERHFKLGVELADRGDFERARLELEAAVAAWPEHQEAHRKLREVRDTLLGGRATDGLDEIEMYTNEETVRLQQNHLEINNHIRKGERFFAARQYEEALKEFKDAVFKVKAIPYPHYPLKQMTGELENYVKRVELKIREEDELRMQRIRAEQEATQAGREQAERREVLEFIGQRLELAFMLFDQKKFDGCAKICDQILLVDPHYIVAAELKQDSMRLRHKQEGYEFIARKVEQWKRMRESDREAVIPYSKTVRFPSREEWAYISRRALAESVGIDEEEGDVEPDLLAVNNLLDGKLIDDFSLAAATLPETVGRLRELTGMNLVLDAKAVEKLGLHGRVYSMKFGRASARSILNTILKEYGLAYTARAGKIVYITDPESSLGAPVPKLHEVADIVARTTDWAAPEMRMLPGLRQGDEATQAVFFDITEKEPETRDRYDDLVTLVKTNVAPGTWDTGTYSLRVTPSKHLLAYHTPQVQDELKEFLSELRSTTGTMVAITTRFIAAYDDSIEEVGVDLFNQPAFAPYVIQGNIPSITTDPPSGTDTNDFSGIRGPGLVIQENARTEFYDLRAQNFNTFRGGGVGAFADKIIGNRVLNTGGIAIQFQMLGAAAMQQVLSAVHKEQKATLMQAPRITVFNTQRAHIMAVRQQAYVQDLTAQLTGATGSLDPEIGILMTGIVLDVTPIVSHDRKYITLEMRPSLAELQTIRNLTLFNANSDQGPFPVNIQLPFVVLQRAEATVIAPDGGTVMLSGFKDIVYQDIEASVPILGDIPILSFLFKRQGKSHEQRRLLILVTPEIIDLQEIEDEQF